MRRDSRLSLALHTLLHMNELKGVVTSETLAPFMQTNPVVLRRTLGTLREAGIVSSEKGHGGGWTLARNLEAVSLANVYEALDLPSPFSIGNREESPGCLIERAVNRALGEALEDAETLLLKRLRDVSLADLARDFHRHHAGHRARRSRKGAHSHA